MVNIPSMSSLQKRLEASNRSFLQLADSKWYLMDTKTDELLSEAFDRVYVNCNPDEFVVVKDGKCGLYDKLNLKLSLPCIYDEIELYYMDDDENPPYGRYLWRLRKDEMVGVYCSIGRGIAVDTEWEDVQMIENNDLLLYREGLVGLFSCEESSIVIPVEYDEIKCCEIGYLVSSGNKWGLYTSDYIPVKSCVWDNVYTMKDGYMEVSVGDKVEIYHLPMNIEPVDLGLSVKWGNRDIPGGFCFGSTVPNDDKNPYVSSEGKLLKYNNYSGLGVVDGRAILLPEDDAATFWLGSNWRMPTNAELKELLDSCSLESSIYGATLTGPNGNSITLKADIISSEAIFSSDRVYGLRLYDQNIVVYGYPRSRDRDFLLRIRPVYDEGTCAKVNESPVKYDVETAAVELDGYVDLGLSVKWAAKNLGASRAAEFGELYNWASIVPNENIELADKKSTDVYFYEKYNMEDELSMLLPEDDAATLALGHGFRIPTEAEIDELINKCCWYDSVLDGQKGFKVVGPSGKAMFIPVDLTRDNQFWSSEASVGQVVSVSHEPRLAKFAAKTLQVLTSHDKKPNSIRVGSLYRTSQLNIRPVCD